MPLPNRIALYAFALAALLGALAPVVADFDFESTAGIAAGLATMAAVLYKWLDNWGKWERGEGVGVLPGDETIEHFDERVAESIPEPVVAAAHITDAEADAATRRIREREGGGAG